MTLSALGIFSAAGAGGPAFSSDYELIETVILGSTTASITFSSLGTYSSTYKHLQIRSVEKTNNGAFWGGSTLRLNGDTGSNYASHYIMGTGSSVVSAAVTSASLITNPFTAGNSAASVFSVSVYDILDPYSTTKNKTVRVLTGRQPEGGENRIALLSGLHQSTSSLTSLTVAGDGAQSFLAGSRFSLYGIKG
jgi:hypothetical protein